MPSDHSKLSPSQAERWFNCPGCLNLIATLPESAFKTSKYAAEGIVAHKLAEEFESAKKRDMLALTSKIGEVVDGVEVTDAMIEGVIEYADHIDAIKKGMPHRPAGIIERTEARLCAASVDKELWGTADKVIYQKGSELHVIDFKYGKKVVEAEENKQGLVYLVAAQDTEAGRAFDKEFFHIVQPRVPGGDSIKTWQLPKGRSDGFRKDLAVAIAKTKDPKAPRCGGPWCRFCPAMGYCPECAEGVQQAVGEVFTKIPGPPSKEVAVATMLPPIARLTKEQVARALDWEDSIDAWFEAVRARALAEMSADHNAIPGYKLVESKTNRAWTNPEAVEAEFAPLGDGRYAPRKLLSPAQMEKVAGKEAVARWAARPPGHLTVAKASDKRATASPAMLAKDVFEELPMTASELTARNEKARREDNIFGELAGVVPSQKKEPFWPQ